MLPSMVMYQKLQSQFSKIWICWSAGDWSAGNWVSGFLKITLARLFLIYRRYRVAAMNFCTGAVKVLILDWLAVGTGCIGVPPAHFAPIYWGDYPQNRVFSGFGQLLSLFCCNKIPCGYRSARVHIDLE